MHITELILEGFKSYPVRTQISGWDPSFNAITGLNGSGKSNILDAICFVLGLTKTDLMRAQNQQDLIYKRGQAGVTKASVTVVFDNSDPTKSPAGYDHCPQITVTRQIAMPNITKYIVNGHKAQQQAVQRLFQSCQLNINNPNFLIMQGKITKVLNMKPQEILGMVEEASGTRTFEERKESARKTMQKKQKDIDALNELLKTEITPTLDKLRNDKKVYLEYQKSTADLEKIERVLAALEWTEYHRGVEESRKEVAANAEQIGEVDGEKEKLEREVEVSQQEKERVVKARDKEMKKAGKASELEKKIRDIKSQRAEAQAQAEGQETEIKTEQKMIRGLEDEQKKLEQALKTKEKELERLTNAYNTSKEAHDTAQAALQQNEDLLQTLLTGVTAASNSGGGGGYMGQLSDAQARLAQAQTREEQARNKLSMQQKELKGAQARFKEVEKEVGQGQRNLEAKKAELVKMTTSAASLRWSADEERKLETEFQEVKESIRQNQQRYDQFRASLSTLNFNYTDPGGNFQSSKVKGMVARLITLAPENNKWSTALEIAAGGRLYNVVVEDSGTAKHLLRRGVMRTRQTIVPLDQIQARTLSSNQRKAISQLAPGKAFPALDLVGYSRDVAGAMAFVFGGTVICQDAPTAKMLAFHRDVHARCVTMEGDVYDPSGTMSGGAAPQSSGILVRAQDLIAAQNKVQESQTRLRNLEANAQRVAPVREQWKMAAGALEVKQHEVKLLEDQLADSNASRIQAQVEAIQKTITDLEAELSDAKAKQSSAKNDIQRLEKDMAEFKNNKEGKTEELRATIQKQKNAVQKKNVDLKITHKDMQRAQLEHDDLGKEIRAAYANVETAQSAIVKLQKALASTQDTLKKIDAEIARDEDKLKQEKAALHRFDAEIESLEKAIADHKAQMTELDVKRQKLDHESQNLQAKKKGFKQAIVALEKRHTWIQEERHLFGQEGGPYEFKEDLESLRTRDAELRTKTTKQAKKVNTKVISQLERDESKEADIKKKLAIVLNDKRMIESTIADLDRMKRDTLAKTWEKVTVDFGNIFGELLPGNTSKLEPPEGKDIMDGLEIKVRLGAVWKQSLTELSGGQRSLIALSLIMALLQYSPAPVYILDEIDAALDLSHTQNIGTLFRTRFKGAQFIVVSLKEGLFTNANVLFKTRFRDGTSIVERTADRAGGARGR
ncbi:unnamed protein product [Peniophora sp. CBMAI 1063]|nr:unnamed protein product [Peniophora sp. CBMAI 1063]